MHNGLGHEIPYTLVDNSHVGVYQVTDGLHFTLQLRVHGEVICGGGSLALNLQKEKREIYSDNERETCTGTERPTYICKTINEHCLNLTSDIDVRTTAEKVFPRK